jgi:hypothetical protein
MRAIREGEIRFVGEKLQFHGAARRSLERRARQLSLREGHTISASQVAEWLVAGVQKTIGLHADLVRVVDKMRRILEKIREV